MTENEIKTNFSRNIKELRIAHKLNQIQLGEQIHYSSKAISKWENEDVLPDITTLKMLADYFGVGVDDLISDKSAINKSHKKQNHLLITISSSLLSFVFAAIVFLILYVSGVNKAWVSFVVAIPTSAVTLIVLMSLWYKKVYIVLAVEYLIIGLALTTMVFMDFYYYWIILIAGIILMITAFFFFNINFTNSK